MSEPAEGVRVATYNEAANGAKPALVSDDAKALNAGRNVHPVDVEVMAEAAKATGIVIESVEQLEELGRMAMETYEFFGEEVRKRMTPELARKIQRLRMVDEYSWRALAAEMYFDFGSSWEPPSNQLAGMQLTAQASEILGETID